MVNVSDSGLQGDTLATPSIILAILTAIMSALITFVNLLTILVIRRTPYLRTLSNMYITSLALSDLVVGLSLIPLLLFFIPYTRVQLFDQNIQFCVLVFGINLGVAVVSNINMTLIAADRYIYITRPYVYKRAVNKPCVFILMACAWVFGVLYALLPQLIHNNDVYSCDATLVMPVWYLFYTNLTMYSLLVITDLVLYSHILYVAHRQSRIITVVNTSKNITITSPPEHLTSKPGQYTGKTFSTSDQITLCKTDARLSNPNSDQITLCKTDATLSNQTHSSKFKKDDIYSIHHIANEMCVEHIKETFLTNPRTISKKSHVNSQTSSSSQSKNIEILQVRRHEQTLKGADKLSTKLGNNHMKSVKFFMTVFGAYFVCLTPTIVCMGLDYYTPVPRFLYNIFNLLALLNSGINFIIYLTLNARFKLAVLRFLGLANHNVIDVINLMTNFDA
ncbi:5-hydroxytryptamine receptor 4 [Biomphalaria pfeifferi]|uniref:5-hydroxytryptamine receptor 4 n=1 Tax=Biomphalaria pfeifferi TaxID=112525 RepID=A0AAD8BFL4_BIOPF|nr:5-hydroxytryptamine receptor 4 [Biomphalaria pfeifferi]